MQAPCRILGNSSLVVHVCHNFTTKSSTYLLTSKSHYLHWIAPFINLRILKSDFSITTSSHSFSILSKEKQALFQKWTYLFKCCLHISDQLITTVSIFLRRIHFIISSPVISIVRITWKAMSWNQASVYRETHFTGLEGPKLQSNSSQAKLCGHPRSPANPNLR